MIDPVEDVCAPAAIERALGIYQQLQERDQSVILQARKILTQYIYTSTRWSTKGNMTSSG